MIWSALMAGPKGIESAQPAIIRGNYSIAIDGATDDDDDDGSSSKSYTYP